MLARALDSSIRFYSLIVGAVLLCVVLVGLAWGIFPGGFIAVVLIGVYGLVVELERQRARAEHSSKVTGQFLANVSHELRTPLNGIMGMNELLLDSGLDGEQLECVEMVRDSAETLLAIIDDILDLSKIEVDKLELEVLDFDLRSVIEEACDVLSQRADEKEIELVCFVPSSVPSALRGDPGRLRQVLLNLVGNAVKFTQEGEVLVEACLEEESPTHATIRVSVMDTGIGIPADRIPDLFRPFSQINAGWSRTFGGTGLGLAISKRLVRMMDGRVGVQSEEAKGSTFWFTVTLEKQPEGACSVRAVPEKLRGLRVLVVDDNATNRRILSHHLSSWGCVPEEASTGEEALRALRRAADGRAPVGLVLLDGRILGEEAEELAARLKELASARDVPVVALTSMFRRRDVRRSPEIGLAGHLNKPVKASGLFECIARVMGAQIAKAEGKRPALVTEHSLLGTKMREKLRVLIVEDNVVNQRVTSCMLQRASYRCAVAANGFEALQVLERMPVDLVLMDCQMPEMDGFEATARIRERERRTGGHVPIIALTGQALAGDRERCLSAGMDDYVSKPVDARAMLAVVERWLAPRADGEAGAAIVEGGEPRARAG